MVANETDQESGLDATLGMQQELRERTAAILQKFQVMESVDDLCREIVHDLVMLCDATQLILYAVDREQRVFYIKCAWAPCIGKWAEQVPITRDNISAEAKVFW